MTANNQWLTLNGNSYSLEQLKSGTFKNNLNSFEQSTLAFCHRWLTGHQEYRLLTSGSTGAPKTITITCKQMEASARLTIHALKLKPGDTSLSLLSGMNVIAVDPPSNPFDAIPQNQVIDFAAFVPYQLQTILLSSSSSRLNDIRCAIIGGAPVDSNTRQKIQSARCDFYATFGMTETISHIALQRLNGKQPQQYFEVLDGVQIEQDDRGCLVIYADYLGREKIVTNDFVEIVSDNKFKWLGRWDNIINTGGVKVSPEKVERAIQEIFDSLNITSRFFVTGLPDKKMHQKIALVVEAQPFEDALQSSVEHAFEKIGRFERPRAIKFVPNFKQTETGKILREETANLIPASTHD